MSETDQKTEKPRGGCTGCAFEYQLSVARSGDHKGELVVRKHNSRVGPGLCAGAQKPPKAEPTDNPMATVDLGESDATGPKTNPWHCTQGRCEGCCGCSQECTTDPCGQPDVLFTTPALAPSVAAAPKPFYAGFSHKGSCGHGIHEGDLTQADGEGGYVCVDCIEEPEVTEVPLWPADVVTGTVLDVMTPDQRTEALSVSLVAYEAHAADVVAVAPGGVPVTAKCSDTECRLNNGHAGSHSRTMAGLTVPVSAPDPFTAPAPASDIPEKTVTVSGQPEPDRDRWGRYLIHGQAHTRATTFAKLGANTKAIEAWNERNVIVGLTRRPDLLMLAEGKEVKRDKGDLNSIAQQAKDAAGSKIAANFGTGYHSFSERIDAGQMTLDQVPERYRGRVQQYTDTVRAWGLVTRPEWIERTTAVRADQVSAPLPVAGTLDRIFQLPDGSLVIGDLKTGADLSYGEMEIEVQLAVYAHGVNTHGLFDWNTKTWQAHIDTPGGMMPLQVRTDIALVIHLPADGDGCEMYVANIARGWEDAQKLGQLQASLKTKNRFRLLTRQDLAPAQPAPAEPSPVIMQAQQEWDLAVSCFSRAASQEQLAELYQFAMDSGRFTGQELLTLAAIGQERLSQLALRT